MTKIASFQSRPFLNINKRTARKDKRSLLFSNFSFRSRDIQVFKISKLDSDDVIHSTRFSLNIMKRDISASLYQECLILCTKILLNVLHDTGLTVLLPWQHTGFQTSPYWKLFLPILVFHFDICWQHFLCMIQQAYKYVSSSLWPRLTFCNLKITNMLKSSWWRLETNELPRERNFLQP